MSTLPLELGKENPTLRTISQPIVRIDDSIKKFIKKMKKTVVKENGVGLAAPQVGKNIRILLAQIDQKMMVMINPIVTITNPEKNLDEEGCLSLPGKFGKVWRESALSVEFLDEKGLKKKLALKNFEARIVLHEVDHLDGVLFTDRMLPEHITEMEGRSVQS